VRILLDNLLGNAWKFTSRRAAADIELGTITDRGEQVFFVRDDGAGFDMSHATRMFAPFQRLHSDVEFRGTGIGLATVQRIVERHGGRIWAEGALGRGATFYFTLPPML
jgi:light-regulated signal transduction histidine kinase (bacteriophytochrome)